MSHRTESFRGGAAAPTDLKEEGTLTSKPGQFSQAIDSTQLGGWDKYPSQGGVPSARTGGGHRNGPLRFGNDEVKPNDMKEDGKWNEDRLE